MLEKIGLPVKPSLRGNNWVVDASHCQGCSSQFTFINRKHHCRRCGGIFCSSCTQQRMVLRGQGDSPVRICDPCKQLEEAARFELRYGGKNRAGRGSSRLISKNENEVLNQLLGNGVNVSSSARRATDGSSGSSSAALEGDDGIDESELGSSISPEELRQQALDEKKRYKVLKGEGKSNEALQAFKRGKELERQADALEISIRKNRRKVLSAETQNSKDGLNESGRKSKGVSQVSKEKDDLTDELRELGWTDMDHHDEDKPPAKMSLEGELFSLIKDTSSGGNKDVAGSGIDKTEVLALKRKALALKREGKLAEAKEELKKAKVLEKQLEEEELLGGAEDSDDEISSLINSMQDNKQDEYDQEHGFDFDYPMRTTDDFGENLEVTDEDLMDPEMASTLKSLGWTDDYDNQQVNETQSVAIDRNTLQSEILSLKREAVNQKRAGNVAEAMAKLKKAKLLEKDLEILECQDNKLTTQNTPIIQKGPISQSFSENEDVGLKLAPKSRLMIQKELLALKKKALTLRREGRLDEAEEELKKGKVLEQQLEEMDNASKAKATEVTVSSKDPSLVLENPNVHGNLPIADGEEDVTDQDMHDPAYLSLLRNLGWNEDESVSSQMKPSNDNDERVNIPSRVSRRSKTEIQRELLSLKRKALVLRREGKSDEAEELLRSTKALETEMEELEAPKKSFHVSSNRWKDDIASGPLGSAAEEGDADDVTEKDMSDPALFSMLKNLGWTDEEFEPGTAQERVPKFESLSFVHSTDPSPIPSSSSISATLPSGKGEVQHATGSLENFGTKESIGFISSPSQSENIMESLTGERRNQVLASKPEGVLNFASDVHSLPEAYGQVETTSSSAESLGSTKNKVITTEKSPTYESNSTQRSTSQINQNSVRQEVLARKRKAVALKREGKLSEAREELRQAKLLEKSLEIETTDGEPNASNVSTASASNASSVQQKETSPSNTATKPLSGRDRFKLQQKSLGHKRQAMKLRREGRTEEAEAEFELAKALELQLDEMPSQNSAKSSAGIAESTDGVIVEDLLDPQLLHALRAIGIEDANVASKGPDRIEPVKVELGKRENIVQERIQLEEQIKAEKVKAVNLKRAGKQAEALEAFRRAKMFEKKLNSLASS
ncbi:uncharacterized protein LOC126658415 isoform X2 [Mercurialis annua]|uniref:uncharacterized protein LOC126658415 isoform X2 n=1 Tax=Mercurialis annua TaxID=3986 RepID=UPI0024AFA276|nr:uncharacterized protein LOC126658415 isoform X2 [Mercurialis annua]